LRPTENRKQKTEKTWATLQIGKREANDWCKQWQAMNQIEKRPFTDNASTRRSLPNFARKVSL